MSVFFIREGTVSPNGEQLSAVWIFEKLLLGTVPLLTKDNVFRTFSKARIAGK
jgi:hypothetical protein